MNHIDMDHIDLEQPPVSVTTPSDSTHITCQSPPAPERIVSLPPPVPVSGPVCQSPVAKKILSRKPTPFNSDLAAAIKKSGLDGAIPDQPDRQMSDPFPNGNHSASNNLPNTLPNHPSSDQPHLPSMQYPSAE